VYHYWIKPKVLIWGVIIFVVGFISLLTSFHGHYKWLPITISLIIMAIGLLMILVTPGRHLFTRTKYQVKQVPEHHRRDREIAAAARTKKMNVRQQRRARNQAENDYMKSGKKPPL
jgi:cytochrome c biogenesis protein CcdA